MTTKLTVLRTHDAEVFIEVGSWREMKDLAEKISGRSRRERMGRTSSRVEALSGDDGSSTSTVSRT